MQGSRRASTRAFVSSTLRGSGRREQNRTPRAWFRARSTASFQMLSFRPQTIFRALFSPDANSIIYSAALSGNRPELFVVMPEYPEPRVIAGNSGRQSDDQHRQRAGGRPRTGPLVARFLGGDRYLTGRPKRPVLRSQRVDGIQLRPVHARHRRFSAGTARRRKRGGFPTANECWPAATNRSAAAAAMCSLWQAVSLGP